MSVIDWVFTGIIILLAARCFIRGFVKELLSVAAYAVGLLAGLLFSNTLIAFAAKKVGIGNLALSIQYVIAFIVCFLLGFLFMKIVERLIREGLEAANLDIFDRILGLVLGIAEGLAVVSLVLIVMDLQSFFDLKGVLEKSLFAKTILPLIGPAVDKALGPALKGSGGSLNLKDILPKKQ